MDKMCPRADVNDPRNVEIAEITCECGEPVEFWKGDEERPCPKCGKIVKRPAAPRPG